MSLHAALGSAWHAQLTRLFFPLRLFLLASTRVFDPVALLRQDSPCISIESLFLVGVGLFPKEVVH